jgi:signal peptidase I, bacterial type
MSDLTSTSPASTTEPIHSPGSNKSGRRLLVAAFVSAVLPGAGHFLINRRRAGIVILILFCALFSICWPLRLLNHFAAVIGLAFGMLALCITAAVNSAYGGRHGHSKPSQLWLLILLPVAVGVAFIHLNWVVPAAGFQSFEVPSRSMENTVPEHAHVMVDRWYYKENIPRRRDLVIYMNRDGIYLIKRVIAMGGETIRSADGQIFIDDQPISEPYAVHSGYAPPQFNNFGPLKIPAEQLFVMGDNRDISLDSRSPEVGPIDITSLAGRPLYTLAGYNDRTYKQLQ